MNIRDLFELSQLDALGLLDEQERAAFDAAFLAAPPEIRAQLRREQARWVTTDFVGCDAEPPEGLRDAVLADIGVAAMRGRVLDAVHREIARVQGSPASLETVLAHAGGRAGPAIMPVRRVSPVWRAAALGFASAAVAFAGMTLYERDRIDQMARDSRTVGEVVAVPGIGDTVFNADVSKIVLDAAQGFKGEAALFLNSEKSEGRLYCRNLSTSPGVVYRVLLVDESGELMRDAAGRPVELARSFTYTGGWKIVQDVHVTLPSAGRIALFEATSNDPDDLGRMVLSAKLA